jgi:Ca2+-binding RTX toxin-like protein
MRNLIGIIALSLLAAAAGCASDTDPTYNQPNDTTASDNPFQAIEQNITGLQTKCVLDATGATMTITLAAGEIALIAKRVVDSAITVNGEICTLADLTPATALASKVKRIAITGAAGSSQMVIVDYTNGTFALGGTAASTTSIAIDLGSDAGDALGVKTTGSADTVSLNSTGVRVNTDAYNDIVLTGTYGATTVYLGAGADTFSAGDYGRAVTVYGGAGADTFNQTASVTGNETIYGGADTDTVSYALRSTATTVSVTLTSGATDADDGDGTATENDDIRSDVEVVIGGSGDDVFDCAAANCTLTGGAGNDTLTGNTGNDTINGGDGNDTLVGGAADDTLNGDAGDDSITGSAGNDTLNGGIGSDTFVEGNATSGSDVFNGGTGTDTVNYSGRSIALTITMDGVAADDGEGSENDNVRVDVENVIGGSANDTITGNALNNEITGGTGNDTLNGGVGDDVFHEGAATSGTDVFAGGDGVDTVDYSGRSVAVVVTMDGVAANDGQASENDSIGTDIENCYGGSANDTITGNDSSNELVGNDGNDTLTGGLGDDVIEGGHGASLASETNTIDCGAGDGDIGYGAGNGTDTGCEFSM